MIPPSTGTGRIEAKCDMALRSTTVLARMLQFFESLYIHMYIRMFIYIYRYRENSGYTKTSEMEELAASFADYHDL